MDDCITQLSEEDSGMERKKPHRLATSPKILTQTIRNILDAAQGKSLAEVSYFGKTHINASILRMCMYTLTLDTQVYAMWGVHR